MRDASQRHVFREPRETRALFGFFAVMFGGAMLFVMTLEALTSFSSETAGTIILFFAIGAVLFPAGIYLLLCVPVLRVDPARREVSVGKSCLLFNTARRVPFARIEEVGVAEAHYSDVHEGGVYFSIEFRGRERIAVPGTKSRDERRVVDLAGDLARVVGVPFNPRPRRIFTGQWVLKSGRAGHREAGS